MAQRIFWVTCACGGSFSVDYALRFLDVELECPYCRAKFQVEKAASVDDRW